MGGKTSGRRPTGTRTAPARRRITAWVDDAEHAAIAAIAREAGISLGEQLRRGTLDAAKPAPFEAPGETPERERRAVAWVSAAEHATIAEHAQARGLSIAELVRRAVLNLPLPPARDTAAIETRRAAVAELAAARGELRRQGGNLRDCAARLGLRDDAGTIDQAIKSVLASAAAVEVVAGRLLQEGAGK